MRGFRVGAALALASAMIASAGLVPARVVSATPFGMTFQEVRPTKRRGQEAGAVDSRPARYRNRWKAERRRKRPNRLTISKRVRRKHRRAA